MDIASLSVKVTTTGVQQGAADLDKLSTSGDKAAKSTDNLNKSFNQSGGIDKPAKAAAQAFNQQTAALAKLAGQIDPTIAKLDKLDKLETQLGKFKKSGGLDPETFTALSSALDASRAKISGASDAVSHFTLNNSLARRELGYLAKDLATGQYGRFQQSALTLANASGVMALAFSGIGVAAIAATTALVGIGIQFEKGANEATAYNKALIVTGDYAGKTADQLADMAKQLDGIGGVTTHAAAEGLAEIAAQGKFAGDQFAIASEAAIRWKDATGTAISETVKQFNELKGDPTQALLKLNETMHFLTQSELDNVKSLQDQGRETEAATEAFKIYANVLDTRSGKVIENLSTIDKLWRGIRLTVDGLADSLADVGRNGSVASGALASVLKNNPLTAPTAFAASYFVSKGGTNNTKSNAFGDVTGGAVGGDGTVDSAKARAYADFQKEGLQYATKQVKLEHDIAQAKAEGLKAGASQLEIDKRIADIQASYADSVKKTASAKSKQKDFYLDDLKQIKAEIEAEGKLMDQRERSREAVAAYQATLQDMLATRQATIDLQVQSIGMGAKEAAQQQALIAIDEDYNRKRASLEQQQRNSTSQIDKAAYTQQLVDLKAYHDERVKIEKEGNQREAAAQADGLKGMQAAVADFIDSQNNLVGQMYDITSQFLGGFGDAFADFVSGTKSAKDAFGSLIDSMYRDALKFVANQEIKKLLESFNNTGTSSASAGGSSAGWAGLFSSVVGAFGPGTIGAGLATGGIASPNSFHPVNERGPEIFTIHGRDYLSTGKSTVKVTPNAGVDRSVSVNQTIVVQGMIGRRTAEQVATATARHQRIAQSRNG